MKLIVYALVMAVLALSAMVGYQFKTIAQQRTDGLRDTCKSFQRFDLTLISLEVQAKKTLPTFAYYKTHPADLEKARIQIQNVIRALTPPRYC